MHDELAIEERLHREYLAYRTQLIEGLYLSSRQYDTALLSLSSGALLLSVGFLSDIAPKDGAELICALKASWILLVVTIFAVLASFLLSQKALDRQLEITDLSLHPDREPSEETQTNSWSTATQSLNWIAGATFFVAVFLTMVFAMANVQ